MAYTSKWWDINGSTVSGVLVADIDAVPEAQAYRLTAVDSGIAVNCVVSTGGVLQAISNKCNNLLDSATIYAGQIIVRSAGNSGTNLTCSGGETYLQDNASVANVEVFSGAQFLTRGGTAENVTVYDGGQILRNGDGKVVWKNLDVKSGGSAVLLANFEITQNINIEAGAYIYLGTTATQDTDVTAVDGTIYNLDMSINGTFSDGITLENLTVTTGDTYIHGTALVNGATVTGGALVFESGGHGTNVTQSAGRVYINSTGVLSGATLKGGEMDVYHNVGGGQVSDITVENGTLLVRWSGNVVNNLTLGGGTVYIQSSGAAAKDITMTGGTLNVYSGASAENITYSNGNFAVSSGATIKNFYKVAGTNNLNILTGGVLDGGAVYMGDVQVLSNNGNTNGTIKNFAIRNVGSVIVRGATNLADTIAISGGILYIQSGASGKDIVMTGGTLNAESGTVSGGTITGGTANFRNVTVSCVTMTGGTANASGNMTVSQTTLSNLTITSGDNIFYDGQIDGVTLTGGALYVRSGTVASNVTQSAGRVFVSQGGTLSGGTIKGSEIDAYHNAGGATIDDLTVEDGTLIMRWANNVANRLAISGGTVYIQSSAAVNDIDMTGGTLNAQLGTISGGTITGGTVTFGNITISDVVQTGGNATANGNVKVSQTTLTNLTVTASTTYIYDASIVEGGTVTGGALQISSGGMATGVTQSAGRVYVSSSAVFESGAVMGGELDVWDANGGGLVRDITVDNGGVIIARSAGNVVDTVRISNGTLHVQNGAGVLNADVYAGGTIDAHNRADAFISGARIHDGGVLNGGHSRIVYYDINVEAGGTWTIFNTFTMGGNINFAEGTLTNDTDAKASNGIIENLDLAISGTFSSGITLSGLNQTAGTLNLYGATVSGGTQTGGDFYVYSGGRLADTEVGNYAWLHQGTAASGIDFKGGTLNVFDAADQTGVERDSVTVEDVLVSSGSVILRGVNASGRNFTVYGGTLYVQNAAVAEGIVLSGGSLNVRNQSRTATVDHDKDGATARNVTILDGANAQVESGGAIAAATLAAGANLTVYKGGQAGLTAAAAGATIDLSFWDVTEGGPGNENALITGWGDFSADAKVNVYSLETGYSYKIADTANANITLDCGPYRMIFGDAVKSGKQYSNAFLGRNLDFSDGVTLITSSFSVDVADTAAKFSATTATALADGGFAAVWNGDTTYAGGNLTIADSSLGGNVWLTLNGFDQSAANIYGAEGAFNHDVNMWLYDGTVKNLAAGAKLGGSVENVNLLISDTGENGMKITNAMYAGGMGNVTGDTETLIEGGTFGGNIFAGALCNYVANNTATDTGDISLTVNGGTFANNLYAGAAVKAGTATSVIHTAGDIAVELNGGSAAKGAFCVYGGGYATGTTANQVYTAGDVDISITGGAWGEYQSGRGIFGGVYADKVAASVEDVSISVTGGSLGNIYGGGWAQNGGTSSVGDVAITIAGTAEVAFVFAGGSYSSVSGGATSVGSVSITVAGGAISGNIFAAGQGEYSTVTGDVDVTFTGSKDYTCSVYGYGVPQSATAVGDRTLAFDGYTGTLSGAVGGFDGIVFSGDTAATLTGAIDNSDWSFDYTDRTASAATAMLTLDNGALAGNVAVDLASVAQAADGWSIAAGLSSAAATFGVELATGSAANLALGDALDDSYGIYEGWGFTLDEGTLKFKQLA